MAAAGRTIPSNREPLPLPDCSNPSVFSPGQPIKQAGLASCATWSRENVDPPGCDWTEKPPSPA